MYVLWGRNNMTVLINGKNYQKILLKLLNIFLTSQLDSNQIGIGLDACNFLQEIKPVFKDFLENRIYLRCLNCSPVDLSSFDEKITCTTLR